MKKSNALICLLCLLTLSVIPGYGQKKNKQQPPSNASTVDQTTRIDPAPFKALRWRNIGPFRGGRSNAVSGVPGNDQVYFTGYTGGGVWKTEDAGATWKNISDGFFKAGSVGEIAVSEADPNVIYVGMGEHAVRGVMTSFGDGVYKSTDGGKTWSHTGLEKTRHIADIAVHPQNADIVFVAAQGAPHGPSEDRGIYKSTDGGQTWKKVLYVDENTGASSLSMDMTNPRILYAATWQHRRYPWKVESGGPGCALWKSTDMGETWKKITDGLPEALGKMGISVSRANPNRVFAIVEAEKSKAGLYRSDNGGMKWTLLSNNQDITSRSWYYMEVFADPNDQEKVYVLNAPIMRSIDGGKTFNSINIGHGDTHDLWINPRNSNNMILGDDGGGSISFNGGDSWSTLNNQPTAQFYRVNADNTFPYKVYGGQQDNSSVVIASRNNSFGISESDWTNGPGCESAYIAFDPDNPVVLYGGCYQGLIEALDTRTRETKDIMEYVSLNLAIKPKDMKYRFNWNAPIVVSPHAPNTIYHAGNVVFKTTDGGMNWQQISPDLTRNEAAKQEDGGGPLTNEGAGGENYNTIYYLIESPLEKGVIYTGSDCGLVHVTRDGGQSWQNITPAGLPECMIQSIEVSPHDKGTAYISATRYKFNDFSALSYKTTDYGKTWTRIADGIDKDDFLKVIREDKKVKDLLYGGAERGFYLSNNGGETWAKFQLNLPVVPVTDLIIHDNDLVAATAGRAFWILDDLGALQQSLGVPGKETVKLYMPKKTVRLSGFMPPWLDQMPPGLGQNPMNGVILTYYLAEKADSNAATLEILDAKGDVIRAYSSKKDEKFKGYPGGPPPPQTIPAQAGINRFAWDFRLEGLPGVPGTYLYGDFQGHRVAPGQYKARLSYKDQTSETAFEIVSDPRASFSSTDWANQQTTLSRVEDRIREIHGAVNRMARVKKQIEGYNEAMEGMPDGQEMIDAGKNLIKKMEEWEANVVERRQKNFQDVINWPSKLNAEFFALRASMDAQDPRVTQGVRDRLTDLEIQWTGYKADLEKLLAEDIKAYNELFRNRNIPALITDQSGE
mgnify:CR=1 FL=1